MFASLSNEIDDAKKRRENKSATRLNVSRELPQLKCNFDHTKKYTKKRIQTQNKAFPGSAGWDGLGKTEVATAQKSQNKSNESFLENSDNLYCFKGPSTYLIKQ